MEPYYVQALALVVAIPVTAMALVAGAFAWARDAVRRSPNVGVVGVLVTLAGFGSLFVPQGCHGGRNLPIVAAFVESGSCQHGAMARLAFAVLCATATAAAVRVEDLRALRR